MTIDRWAIENHTCLAISLRHELSMSPVLGYLSAHPEPPCHGLRRGGMSSAARGHRPLCSADRVLVSMAAEGSGTGAGGDGEGRAEEEEEGETAEEAD